ncbi:GNAT family N-acetyltransferase [Kitasatospora cinereorecta]|uniref:GNAT family N-acetyltransferase n=1 Tax=Kitasatospora cinereorecta TaxID=285560 RepID=A0ABW0VJA8_9ACTN
MSDDLLSVALDFRIAFARRQAARVIEVAGGFVVLDEEFRGSHEHNQLFVERAVSGTDLEGLADRTLGHLNHRRITVLDDALGRAAAPLLTAAGYEHSAEVLMVHTGAAPGDGGARTVTAEDLRPAELGQWRRWLPDTTEEVLLQLCNRRRLRHRGADLVDFLAVRDSDGAIGSWADLYQDTTTGIAQIEDVATDEPRRGRGLGDAVLTSALHRAAATPGHRLTFLVALADDWPREWYARRGFTPIAHTHGFTRS